MSSERRSAPSLGVGPYERTYVGIDVGEKTLAAVAPAGTPGEAVEVGAEGRIRGYWNHLRKTTQLLSETPGVPANAEAAVLASEWRRMREHLEEVIDDVLDVVEQHPHPILVREEFNSSPTAAWCHRHSRELGGWLIPTLIEAIDQEAAARGVDVVGVEPDWSSQVCHRCLERGRLERETFRCQNESCGVDYLDRDVNAALVLADRGRYGHRRRFREVNR
ncbi:zinc ribbon domain-containing protein [Halorubrum halodurans]|uniref:Cas12f1-like TNB domain-containing protein n=1 Tax=Halorubrum halodurans TaxID=1383851 RepID=A0A256IPZ4_9EURY|nr:zinc ribbon domain-containing protein [Halorubrum halodurans]OYR58638.1 hypothetical protein DJ70_02615 [Halorubrum halodurans]